MTLDIVTVRDKLVDHALSLGYFDSVNSHIPDAVPGTGAHAVVEFTQMVPARSSGLASTSMVITFSVYVFVGLEQEPADDIDIRVVQAADALIGAYIGDFELGGNVRMVDVRGAESAGGGQGAGLTARADYASIQGTKLRAIIIQVPLIVNDVYVETP